MLTREDWNVYTYGSSYWHDVNDRIFVAGVNDKEFFEDLFETKSGKSFKKRLDCDENRVMLFKTYSELYPNQPIIRSRFGDVLHKLMLAYTFIDPNAEPEEPEDTRPRDATGRVMSPKAIRWQEFENWCNDPRTSMREINELRRTDTGFAEFYAHYARQERTATPVGDARDDQNVLQKTSKNAASADVQCFAQEYRTMSSQQLKTLLSPGLNPLGPADATHNQQLFDAAIAAGLI